MMNFHQRFIRIRLFSVPTLNMNFYSPIKNNKKNSLFSSLKWILDSAGATHISQFSPDLVTPFNDGPASFHPDSNLVVYSRNLDAKAKPKNMLDLSNKLGLFFAELIDGEWIPIEAFPFNNADYSITTPCFSTHGDSLYFASDMLGGFGGTDLYFSVKSDSAWSIPVNLGEKLNTPGNEVYPFVALNGDLFFASDGLGGLGKKDIFLTRKSGSDWITPVHLDAPINSPADDFGLVTNKEFSEGYFSTSRGTTDDIYHFTTVIPQLFNCDTLLVNNYCFEFWDDAYLGVDSLPVTYEWEFSDGTKLRGLSVEHCLPGAGQHWAKLNIIDSTTSSVFFTQTSMEFELEDYVQPYITCKDTGIINNTMEFSGLQSNLPGYSIEEYIWDFGEGKLDTGAVVKHQFDKAGEYAIKLGLKAYSEGLPDKEIRCVVKPITLLEDNQALAMHLSGIDILVAKEIESSKLKGIGYGESKPISTNRTE